MSWKAIIVDDEELARKRLRKMLQKHENQIQVVAEADSGPAAVQLIEQNKPDLILLDIQMPGLNGFEVIERLSVKPLIIFATAYDEYALRAFEEFSIDYLLKPIEQRRLDMAVSKFVRILERSRKDFDVSLQRLLLSVSREHLKRIQVKLGDKILLFGSNEIAYFDAEEKQTFLHTMDQSYAIDYTLSELEEKLDSKEFIRIHRSTIVSVRFIREIVRWFGGKYLVRLKDKKGSELVASRGYADNLTRL